MSTNYYADFKLGNPSDHNTMTYRMHIGKGNWSGEKHGFGISTMNGKHFPTIDSWVTFLRHNNDAVTVRDECEDEQDTEEFIKLLENPAPTSDNQIAWLREHENDRLYSDGSLKIWDEPQPTTWRAKYWIDQASGKLFYSGEFS